MHTSLGFIVFCLIYIRLIYHFAYSKNFEPLKKKQQVLANLGHFVIYVLTFLAPFVGWMMINARDKNIKIFGLDELSVPQLINDSDMSKIYSLINNQSLNIKTQHEYLAEIFKLGHRWICYALIAIIVTHIIGAIVHKKQVLHRMF